MTAKERYQLRLANAHARRKELLDSLGGRCVDCGSTERLEFDHNQPRTWIASKVNQITRTKLYERDIAAGHIKEIRCRVCNARKGRPEDGEYGFCGFCGSPVPEGSECDCDY